MEALISGISMVVGGAIRACRCLSTLPMWWSDAYVSFGSIRTIVFRVLFYVHYCKLRMIGVMAFVISWVLIAPIAVGKTCSRLERIRGSGCSGKIYGKYLRCRT